MFRRLVAGLALVVAIVQPSAAQTTLDFEDLVSDPFTIHQMPANFGGISWGAEWGYYNYADASQYSARSGSTRLLTNRLDHTPATETFWDFLSPTQGISAWFSGSFGQPVSLNFYYQGFLVHSTSTVIMNGGYQQIDGTSYAGLVDRVGVFGNRGFYVMDDLSFDGEPTSTVPEPATMTLLATGLAGMAAARRRRKA